MERTRDGRVLMRSSCVISLSSMSYNDPMVTRR